MTKRLQPIVTTSPWRASTRMESLAPQVERTLDDDVTWLRETLESHPEMLQELTDEESADLQDIIIRSPERPLSEADRIAVETAVALAEQVQVTGESTVNGELARRPFVRRGIELDGVWVDALDPRTLPELAKDANLKASLAALIFQYMIMDGRFSLRRDQLPAMIQTIHEKYNDVLTGKAVTGLEGDIAQRIAGDDLQPRELATTLAEKTARSAVPGLRARALNEVLTHNPGLAAKLREMKVRLTFTAANDATLGKPNDAPGGAEFKVLQNRLYIGDMPSATPDEFARLFLHETGHATFQRVLLANVENGLLPQVINTGQVEHLLTRRRAILAALQDRTAAPAPPPGGPARRPGVVPGGHRRGAPDALTAELADINGSLHASGFKTVWERMTEDAQDLFRAWITLRRNYGRNNGEYMLGVDLGSGRRPADRQVYQAGAFSEFCAESFMHEGMGDLDDHVDFIMGDPDVPDNVKQAWRMAHDVFKKHARPILDGQPVPKV